MHKQRKIKPRSKPKMKTKNTKTNNYIQQPVGAGFHACPTTEIHKKTNAIIASINNANKDEKF